MFDGGGGGEMMGIYCSEQEKAIDQL